MRNRERESQSPKQARKSTWRRYRLRPQRADRGINRLAFMFEDDLVVLGALLRMMVMPPRRR